MEDVCTLANSCPDLPPVVRVMYLFPAFRQNATIDALGTRNKWLAAGGWQFFPQANGKYLISYREVWCKKISINFIETFHRLEVNSTILLLTRRLAQGYRWTQRSP